MRTRKAYLAGLGTTGALLAATLCALAIVSAIVAFDGWPGTDVGPHATTLAGDPAAGATGDGEGAATPGGSASRGAADRDRPDGDGAVRGTVRGGQAAPGVSWSEPAAGDAPPPAQAAQGGRSGSGARAPAAPPPAQPSPGDGDADPSAPPPGGLGETVEQVTDGVGTTVGQVGAGVGDAVEDVTGQAGGLVGQVSPGLGQAVTQTGQGAGGLVGSTTGAVGGILGGLGGHSG